TEHSTEDQQEDDDHGEPCRVTPWSGIDEWCVHASIQAVIGHSRTSENDPGVNIFLFTDSPDRGPKTAQKEGHGLDHLQGVQTPGQFTGSDLSILWRANRSGPSQDQCRN